ncbi:YraN family protein [Pseudooceanicola aestuarii]|uniref:YraN family protein n=1 Tax=Pseudooceanicola aestuarii TaxID=2697319 RepID=UPI001EF8466A|nr:YraN family protein [Pseudooceanicola aestuarii]
MEFDFFAAQPVGASVGVPARGVAPADVRDRTAARRHRGRCAYLSGLAAEGCVERHYRYLGYRVERRRWRGPGGEIDLILSRGNEFVFVEVKSGRRHAWAAERVSARQIGRICRSAEDYLGRHGDFETRMRLDVALVDRGGVVSVLENVTMDI